MFMRFGVLATVSKKTSILLSVTETLGSMIHKDFEQYHFIVPHFLGGFSEVGLTRSALVCGIADIILRAILDGVH
jgi:hypothetical protein